VLKNVVKVVHNMEPSDPKPVALQALQLLNRRNDLCHEKVQ
jgi:hypothetical protein